MLARRADNPETIGCADAGRGFALAAGAALVFYSLRHRRGRLAAALGGSLLLYRGAKGRWPGEAMEIESAGGAMRIEESVTINRPAGEVFRHWRNLENLPSIMRHVESVSVTDGRSRWVARTPLETPVEWEAEIVEERENELISWRSLRGDVVHSGAVSFRPAPGGRATELRLRIEYAPAGGTAARAGARLLNFVTGRQVKQDLRRFKAALEAGGPPTTKGQPSGRAAKPSRVASAAAKAARGAVAAARKLEAYRNRHAIDFRDKVVVISGGSRGLGLELARRFAREGAMLALLARDRAELERACEELARKGVTVIPYPCDIRDRVEVEHTVGEIMARMGRIDVLINNAGIIQVGPFEHMQLEDFEDAVAVHLWGPLYLMQAVIPHMKARRAGRIVNIASIGGKVALPHLAPYCASKFALVGLSDGLRSELGRDGIRITTVSPGLMRTGSHWNAFFKGRHEREFALFSISNALPLFSISSERAARQIVNACRLGQAELVITVQARMLGALNALFPKTTAAALGVLGRLLPGPADESGNLQKRGWESQSFWAPSWLTRPADCATLRNNEVHQASR